MATEPLGQFLKSGVLASVVGAVVTAGVSFGILTSQQGDAVKGGLVALVTVVSTVAAALPPILAAFHARSKVTPTPVALVPVAPTPQGKHEARDETTPAGSTG